MDIRICLACKEILPNSILFFNHNNENINNLSNFCKHCSFVLKQNNPGWIENHYKCNKCKKYYKLNDFINMGYDNNIDIINDKCKHCTIELCNNRRKGCKNGKELERILSLRWYALNTRNKKKNRKIDFDKNYLLEIYNKQKGKCALSNLDMSLNLREGKNNLSISVDRIDSNKGYTKENTRLVCSIFNIMKGSLSDSELVNYCKLLIKMKNKL